MANLDPGSYKKINGLIVAAGLPAFSDEHTVD
jgi:hypothetical protein